MNGVMASALTVHSYYLKLTVLLLGKGSKAIEALTKVILDKRCMARKFGLLCLVQVSNFFLQVAKIYEFSIPLLDP